MQSAVPELCDLFGESAATQKLYGIDQTGTTTAAYGQRSEEHTSELQSLRW
jgi:hypothetical protein